MHYLRSLNDQIDTFKASSSTKTIRMKAVEELLRMVEHHAKAKPLAGKYNCIRFKGRREAFRAENDEALRRFPIAQCKLKPHFTAAGKNDILVLTLKGNAIRSNV